MGIKWDIYILLVKSQSIEGSVIKYKEIIIKNKRGSLAFNMVLHVHRHGAEVVQPTQLKTCSASLDIICSRQY